MLNIGAVHESLKEMHREVAKGNELRGERAQRLHNARTNVSPIIFIVRDYAMMRTTAKNT